MTTARGLTYNVNAVLTSVVSVVDGGTGTVLKTKANWSLTVDMIGYLEIDEASS